MISTHNKELEFVEIKNELTKLSVRSLLSLARDHPASNKEENLYHRYQADPKYHAWAAKEEDQLVGLVIFHLDDNQAIIDHICSRQLSQALNIAGNLIHFIKSHFHLKKISVFTGKKNLKLYQELGFRLTENPDYFECIWEKG